MMGIAVIPEFTPRPRYRFFLRFAECGPIIKWQGGELACEFGSFFPIDFILGMSIILIYGAALQSLDLT